jgi:signal transduction histidine kinase/ActR/RegA family two-component response regulator
MTVRMGDGRASFRSIVLLFVALSLVPLILFSSFLVRRVVASERASAERLLLQGARLQSDAIEQELSASVRALSAMAESPLLTAGDLRGFYDEHRRVAGPQSRWYSVQVLDPFGHTLMNTREPWGAPLPDPVDPASVHELITTRKPVIGTLKRDTTGTFAFAIRVPVFRDGGIRYVLSAFVRPEALTAILQREFHPHDEWTRALFDPAGTIVARTRSADGFVGRQAKPQVLQIFAAQPEGIVADTAIEGEPVYVAFSRGHTWGWRTATVVPRRVLDAPSRQSKRALAAMSALTVALSGFVAWGFAGRVSRDLRRTTAAAARLSRGDTALSASRSRVAEIAELDGALNQSAVLLAERGRDRERLLAEATDARAVAEASARAKDEFLAMLGHELRNPLSPIVTALHLLRMRRPHVEREYAVIERQVHHLTGLVDDLLDVSRITRGKIQLKRQTFELREVVDQAVEMSAPLFEQREQTLHVEAPAAGCAVVGDPARLAQVVSNLLVNASKYTPPSGSVWVTVRHEAGDVVLRVQDTGRGLSTDLLPRVFDLFVQGPRAIDRQEGGLGLGLTLVKQLVQLHGGSVHADSPGPDQGSTFTVRLPVAAVAPQRQSVEPHPPNSGRSLRVLIVDDNADALEMLSTLVSTWGHQVMAVGDTSAALDRGVAFNPEVALLDIGLPVMDGYELAAALRVRVFPSRPLFIAVTGYGQSHDVARSLSEGFAAHLVKPIDADQLERTLAGEVKSAVYP